MPPTGTHHYRWPWALLVAVVATVMAALPVASAKPGPLAPVLAAPPELALTLVASAAADSDWEHYHS
jgi:hypothetical protein